MEYAEDSLFNLKQKFLVFKEKEILEVVRQLLNGLQYLHILGIVHADLKLENIMISNVSYANMKGTVKLCDFGYAHKHLEIREKEQVVGTL
jgi:mitogen-activated protein kinase kinase kinase 1